MAGATLETTFGLDISNTPLWFAKAVIKHPDTIHRGASRVPARRRTDYPHLDPLMLTRDLPKSRLAVEARRQLVAPASDGADPKIALSAGLSPAQEFDGFYPPRYGPRAYTPDGPNLNAFAEADGRAAA
ncbi:Hcy-binding domain-containing protein [Mycena kentingensis (nom. inval.)]|nr:Hcy-binding domain-containing protein [Mycena kentingensis (nom. inval.)]